jgi:DNA-binding CsgD family transcriptional regulator
MSVRTVEGHLSSAYRKLGVRSRTELTVRLAANSPKPGSDAAVPARQP